MRFVREGIERLAAPAEVVREMDRRTIEEYGIPGAVLMENAGSAAAQVAAGMLERDMSVLVLAGAGNNAGDGFVIARHLANYGWTVRVNLAVPRAKYRGDAGLYLEVIEKMGLEIEPWRGPEAVVGGGLALLVDALLGTGLKGALRPPFPEIIAFINDSGIPVLAVDIPSGLDADSGEVATAAVNADVTVTFALPKTGLFAGQGPKHTGQVVVADIGMPYSVYPEGKALYPR